MDLFTAYKPKNGSTTPDRIAIHPGAKSYLVEAIDDLIKIEAAQAELFISNKCKVN